MVKLASNDSIKERSSDSSLKSSFTYLLRSSMNSSVTSTKDFEDFPLFDYTGGFCFCYCSIQEPYDGAKRAQLSCLVKLRRVWLLVHQLGRFRLE